MRQINKIIVHCSASPDYSDIGYKEIKHLHTAPKDEVIDWYGQKINGRAWSDIGYHYIAKRNGELEKGRPDEIAGAHAYGANSDSIGIVWVGTNNIEPKQERNLIRLIHFLMGKYNVDVNNVLGHKESVDTDKSCPNLNMDRLRAELIFVQTKPEVR